MHKHGSLGCIDVKNVLEPLEFVLPKREVPIPVVDLSDSLSSLTTQEPEAEPEEKLSEPVQVPAETTEPSIEEPTVNEITDATDNLSKDVDLDDMEDFLSGEWTVRIHVGAGVVH